MPSADLKSSPKNALPVGLQDLLVREAAFVLGRNRIGEALVAAEALKTAVARSRPWISYIIKDRSHDHAAERKELLETIEVLERGVQKFESAGRTLYACVQRSLENYLREHDPEYVNGLSASRFLDDWKRLLTRFEEAVSSYVALLKRLASVAETLPAESVCGANQEARELIDQTVTAALAVQEEVTFVNKIADTQRIRAGIDAITLYRQPERNWKTLVHSLHFMAPPAANQEVRALLADTADIAEKVRSAIKGELQLASYVVGYGVTSYHERVWASLREAAPLRIKPDELESILAETEDRIDQSRLEDWVPLRTEPVAVEAPAPVPAPPPPALVKKSKKAAKAAARAAAAESAGKPGAGGAELKLPSRGGATGAAAPSAATASDAAAVPETGSAPRREAEDTVEDLLAERRRLEDIMSEMRSGFSQREEFLTQSEERLMQASQAQQEREMELEQREEQLRDLERRLKEMQNGGKALVEVAPKKEIDEFNE